MALLRLAGYLLIASFAFLAIGELVAPPAAYSGPDLESRLAVIAENDGRWKLSKVFDGLAVVTPALAAVVLLLALRGEQPPLAPALAALAFLVSAVVGLAVVYRLAFNPALAFAGSLPPLVDLSGALGWTLGMLFLGWVYLQGAFPQWIGYLSLAVGAMSLVAYFFIGFSLAFYRAAVLYLVNTVIGVVIVRVAG